VLIRVATWNIKHGAPRPMALADAVRALADIDVLALQEVDVGDPRSGSVDQAALVGDVLGMGSVFGKSLTSRRKGDYGNALLVRGEIVAEHLPLLEEDDQDRSALLARVDVHSDETAESAQLSVATTHLSTKPANSARQLTTVLDALLAMRRPAVLIGDLNRTWCSLRRDDRARFVRAGWSFPARFPRKQIDHVGLIGDVEATRTEVRRLAVSDHRAVVADLEL
jgi:endonuclease/exonuclease/phosphatase family metal-dependent hydrolase